MVLDTFMYLDYKEAREGVPLREILTDLETHPDYGEAACILENIPY